MRREVAVSGSPTLAVLLAEVEGYPGGVDAVPDPNAVVVPLVLEALDGTVLTFVSTVTTFGTALDPVAAEVSVEAFLPADAQTAAACTTGLTT